MPTRLPQADRMGALPPRYSFFLNPHANERFTRCPRCKATTRVRKIPLVIHVDSMGLVLLRKTCRLCVVCEMLEEVKHDMADFKAYVRVEITPRHWARKDSPRN